MLERPSTFKDRLAMALSTRGYRQIEVSRMTDISRSLLNKYLKGVNSAGNDNLYVLSQCLRVNPLWLMGYDVPMEEDYKQEFSEPLVPEFLDDIIPIDKQSIPFLGEIACGKPIYANENRESYVQVGTEIHADFCLRAKGDSMIGARINDGDIVFIKKQEMVNNGEIAAVIIEDEATLKRVYYYPEKSKLVLQAENSKYEPLVYVGEELNDIRILGKAIAFQSDVT